VSGLDADAMLRHGLGHVPEDRLRRGLVPQFSIAENLILGYHHDPAFVDRGGVMRQTAIRDYAAALVRQYDVRVPSESIPAGRLSGGNQQKVVVARVFTQDPRALVVAQPTRGLDVGAIEYIHRRILELRDRGKAILFISADLDEVRAISDRLAVLSNGAIVSEGPADALGEAEIGLLMAGGRADPTPVAAST
jgi:simple sugar transport system ATP-binding protein